MTGTANIAPHTLRKKRAAQCLLSLALIDMANDNPQSSKQSKSSSRFKISRRPISPAPSEQSQEYSSKRSQWAKLFSKSPSTRPIQSTSSLPLVSSTVDSRGETALGEHVIIFPFVLLSTSESWEVPSRNYATYIVLCWL